MNVKAPVPAIHVQDPVQKDVLYILAMNPVLSAGVIVNLLRSDLNLEVKKALVENHYQGILSKSDFKSLIENLKSAWSPRVIHGAIQKLHEIRALEDQGSYTLNFQGSDGRTCRIPVSGDTMCVLREEGRSWLTGNGKAVHAKGWHERNQICWFIDRPGPYDVVD